MVPEGWKIEPLETHIKIKHGFAFSSAHYSLLEGDILLTPGNFYEEGGYRAVGNKQKRYVGPRKSDYILNAGDMLVAMTEQAPGLLGSTMFVPDDGCYLHNQRLGLVVTEHNSIDLPFLHSVFSSPTIRNRISAEAGGTKVRHTSPGKITALEVLLPPLPEQRKIADILSTWDQTIEKTEALLSNARTQKRALMQQLLTGKRRFPAFEDQPWKEVRLGDVGKFRKGKGLPKTVVGPVGEYPCVLYGELYTTYGEFIGQTKSRTDVDDGVISVAGDILIPASTTTSGIDLAIASYVESSGVRLGGDINIFRPKQNLIEGAYLAYFLTHARRHPMARFAQGITIVHLKGADLLDLSILVPPLAEQKVIMSLVTDVESEIVSIAGDLTKLRAEKKALMQQLLTGKRRVLV